MHVHERARCLAQYLTGQLIKADLADSGVLQHLQHLLHGHDEVDVNVPALVLQDNVGGSGSHASADNGANARGDGPARADLDTGASVAGVNNGADASTAEQKSPPLQILLFCRSGWDLGGQEEFSALHHGFLSPSAIYVFVFSFEELLFEPGAPLLSLDPQTQEPNVAAAETKGDYLRDVKYLEKGLHCGPCGLGL